ncbi:MAG: WbuC family cupin fold metalloprotein [Breznakibacter sp.]
MQIIDTALILGLQQAAQNDPRLRKNHNFHTESSDPLQRMLNAIEPGSYVQPHRHIDPAKREMFIILKGRVVVFIFDDHGAITHSVMLDAAHGNLGIEIMPQEWHSIVSLEPGSVVFEVKDGPYSVADDKWFAPWAPQPGTPEANTYLKSLEASLGSNSII